MPIRPSRFIKESKATNPGFAVQTEPVGFVVAVHMRTSGMERPVVSLSLDEDRKTAKENAAIFATRLRDEGWKPSDAFVTIAPFWREQGWVSAGKLRVQEVCDHDQDNEARAKAEAWTRADRAVRLRIEASKR